MELEFDEDYPSQLVEEVIGFVEAKYGKQLSDNQDNMLRLAIQRTYKLSKEEQKEDFTMIAKAKKYDQIKDALGLE